jgi:hypothetical protein
MNKRRPDTLSDLRRQRQRLRRIGVVALLAGGLFALASCEELTRRGAAQAPPSPITLHAAAAERAS